MARLPLGAGEPFRPLPRSLLALAGVIVCIELFLELADRGILSDPTLRSRVYMVGAFWSGLLHGARPIFEGQGWTMFVTHAFLHGGFLHMAMNTAVLLGLGRFTADRYGAWTVLPVFLVSAVAGGLAFGLMSSDPVPMVGASGAVFGFVGVWTVWDWRRLSERGASVRPVATRIAALAGMNALFFFGLSGMLAWQAHLGGFLAGLALGAGFERRDSVRLRRSRAEARARRGG
jgi:membrane associated rhomboid family serine protease